MHLAIFSAYASVCIENHSRIVIEARRTPLEHARNDNHTVGSGGLTVKFSKFTRNLLRIPEIVDIFSLTEIKRIMQFRQHHHLCSLGGKIFYGRQIAGAVRIDIFRERMLYYSYFHIYNLMEIVWE